MYPFLFHESSCLYFKLPQAGVSVHIGTGGASASLIAPGTGAITDVTIENLLTAYVSGAGAGQLATIGKDSIQLTVGTTTSPVPLPASVWLMAGGFAGLLAIGRRARREQI